MTGSEPPELIRQRAEKVAGYLAAAAPVLTDLAAAGVEVSTIGEVGRQGMAIARKAVPVLERWLAVETEPAVRADIIRALGGRWARSAAPALIAAYREAPPGDGPGRRWQIGNALAEAAGDEVFDDVVVLACDPAYGKDRQMVVLALANMSDPRAVDVLLELTRNEEVAGQAATALGKLRAERARPVLTELARHPKAWVRQEAVKALRRLDR
jgi:HEAT repeat protein